MLNTERKNAKRDFATGIIKDPVSSTVLHSKFYLEETSIRQRK